MVNGLSQQKFIREVRTVAIARWIENRAFGMYVEDHTSLCYKGLSFVHVMGGSHARLQTTHTMAIQHVIACA